jgi:hypothetical protein
MEDHDTAPRQHHYVFAHRALRAMVTSDPKRGYSAMTGKVAKRLLLDLWKRVGDLSDEETLPSNGLACSVTQLDDRRTVAIVTMPPAERITEAHFIGVVFIVVRAPFRRRIQIRYFTLEHSEDLEHGSPTTMLCEWRGETHVNYGEGPEPSEEAFLDALIPRLA